MRFPFFNKKKEKEDQVIDDDEKAIPPENEKDKIPPEDDGEIPLIEDGDDQSVILDDDKESESDKDDENGEAIVEEDDDKVDKNKYRYEFTKEQIGDILGDKIIKTDTEDIVAFIQQIEIDPITKNRTCHKVLWFGDEYGTFPINLEDMVDGLQPGRYNVRVVDAKNVRRYFGGFRVSVGLPEEKPAAVEGASASTEILPPPPQPGQTLDDRLRTLEMMFTQTNQMIQGLATNMVPKSDPQQMMNTMLMAVLQKSISGGNGSDRIIEKVSESMLKTQEMIMGLRTKVEEKKLDFDFEKIKQQNMMEIKKIELAMASGKPPVTEEEKKSRWTIDKFVDGIKGFMEVAGPALKEIRKLRELEMGIAPTDDVVSEEETTP